MCIGYDYTANILPWLISGSLFLISAIIMQIFAYVQKWKYGWKRIILIVLIAISAFLLYIAYLNTRYFAEVRCA